MLCGFNVASTHSLKAELRADVHVNICPLWALNKANPLHLGGSLRVPAASSSLLIPSVIVNKGRNREEARAWAQVTP